MLLADTDQIETVSTAEATLSIGILLFYAFLAVATIIGLIWVILDRIKARKTETFEKRDN